MTGVPFTDLLNRVIQQESGGNPNAVSPAGAAGLMQVMPDTARDPGFGVAPLPWDRRFDATANKRFGSDYLSAMINHFGGDQERALVAYNWGAGNAQNWDGDRASLPAETQGYLANILGGAAAPAFAVGAAPAQTAPPAAQIPMLPALPPMDLGGQAATYGRGTPLVQPVKNSSFADLIADVDAEYAAQLRQAFM